MITSLLLSLPITLYGNAYGLYSPNGSIPQLPTTSQAPKHSRVHKLPSVPSEPTVEVIEPVLTVCPTLLSQPHLCE